ncbi:hypothetical protein [Formosa haliotis]|uniref:hypothetical protein n=1 Tax=Formosa haliotis TaxID=1555194 RepID=UPI000826D464|nr:hypothetical protein [Formosa haliotis]
MSNNLKHVLFIISCLYVFLYANPVQADIVFPARLELRETKPGVFQVVYVLPVMQGKVLKATPLLPDLCSPLGEAMISGNENTKRQTWTINCTNVVLEGQRIGIDGLQGSPVDILLAIEMLDGRTFNTTLSSIRPYYVIPKAPSIWFILKEAAVKGMRIPLSIAPLLLLLLALLSFKIKTKTILFTGLTFSIALAIGHYLAIKELVKIMVYLPAILTYTLTIILVLYTLTQQKFPFKASSTIVVATLLGLAFGSAILQTSAPLMYSNHDTTLYHIFILFGIFIGVSLAFALSFSFLDVIHLITSSAKLEKYRFNISVIIGILACGCMLYESTIFWVAPSLLPSIPVLCIVYVKILAGWLGWSKTAKLSQQVLVFGLPLVLGLVLGFWLQESFYTLALVVSATLYMCIQFGFNVIKNTTLHQLIFAGSSVACGIYMSSFASNTISYAPAQTVGFFIILALIFTVVYTITSALSKRKVSAKVYPIVGTLLILYILTLYITLGKDVLLPIIKNTIASGLLPVPALSLILLLVVIIFWPRYKKIHKALNIQRKKPVISLGILALALCSLPILFKLANPWYVPHAPNQQDVTLILTQVLYDTYTAFNNTDEEQLFNDLSKTVDDNLIDDLYLDSRRLLNSGLREGAEVTVQNVKIESVDSLIEASPNDTTFEYPTEWVVTARVKHLQHIHYRQNRYTGVITMHHNDNVWKIAAITLNSENRTVIASSTP